MMRSIVPALLLVLAYPAAETSAQSHGIAMHGSPALADGFEHFPYVNPGARKGGRVVLGQSGSFDTLNPLIVKGDPAAGIRDFAIESLMVRSLDEPFTLYPLIAQSVDVPADRSAATFHINPKARFSDGTPVTADDVLFSFNTLREKGRPNHRTYFKKVATAEKLDDLTVRFAFQGGDRELPLILGVMPVLSHNAFTFDTFEETTLKPFVSSGPYVISKVDAGASITYTRNPDYWGRDLPVNIGRFNFDEIRFDYYRDPSTLLEALKTGAVDVRSEDDPARWAEGYQVPALAEGRLVKAEFATGLPAGMLGLAFNTRHAVFAKPAVRNALIHLFDFEWVNRNLYHGLYKRTQSYFERSALSSAASPADARERQLLAPFPDAVLPDVIAGTYRQPSGDGTPQDRANAKAALALLTAAGYKLDGGVMRDTASGSPLAFEILASSNAQERLFLSYKASLARLGITASIRVVDSAQYQARLKDYDFDMIQFTWPSSLSPGNEQLFRWSSAVADQPGSFNYPGVRNPAADAMIDALLKAATSEDFVSAVRALDRVLLSGYYVVPLFHTPKQWVAHWAYMKYPATTPVSGYNLDSWWTEKP